MEEAEKAILLRLFPEVSVEEETVSFHTWLDLFEAQALLVTENKKNQVSG